jgi:ABC-type antimicrobial peptide transport system permease subunit
MKFNDLLFTRRMRQNHALEHATVTILSQWDPNLSVTARSTSDGFIMFGGNIIDIDLGVLRRGVDEALARLQAGEAELAIHPNCGTNLAVGISLVTVGTMLGMSSSRTRTRVTSAVVSSLAGMAAARPVGEFVQRHFTTLPDLLGVHVTDIFRRKLLGFDVIEVRTALE